MVGWRYEAPLVPPYRLCGPNKAMALRWDHRRFLLPESPPTVPPRSGPSGRGEIALCDLAEESPGFTGHGGG